jgi:hypothetical protein
MVGEVARRLVVHAVVAAVLSPSAASKALAQDGTCAGRQTFDPRRAIHPAREALACVPRGLSDLLCACLRSDRGVYCADVSAVAVRGGQAVGGGDAPRRRTAEPGRPAQSTGWRLTPLRTTRAPALASHRAPPVEWGASRPRVPLLRPHVNGRAESGKTDGRGTVRVGRPKPVVA